MVLRRGDPVSGAILVIALVKGVETAVYERFPSLEGGSTWQPLTAQTPENAEKFAEIRFSRAARDPDLWIIELNVASLERLTPLFAATA